MILLLCFFISFAPAYPQNKTSAQRQLGITTASQSQQPQLQLTASIANQRYTVEYGVRMLRWTLKLTYTNAGSEPILLDKKSSLIYRSMASRSLKAAASKKYEYDLTSHFITVENMRKAGFRDGDPQEDAFITLRPGESYSLKTDYGARPYDRAKAPDGLRPGSYFLELRVATWYYYFDPAPYSEKWRSKGHLWSQNVTSQPMPFTIEKQ